MPGSSREGRKVLIVAPNWIGDAVLSLPVVDGARNLWPKVELTVLARVWVAQLFACREPAVRVLQYERGDGVRRLGGLLGLARRLRGEGFHLALVLPNSLSSGILVWFAGVSERLGYATDGRGWFLSRGVGG